VRGGKSREQERLWDKGLIAARVAIGMIMRQRQRARMAEPETMALLAPGLIGMAIGAVLRRRSRSGYAPQFAR